MTNFSKKQLKLGSSALDPRSAKPSDYMGSVSSGFTLVFKGLRHFCGAARSALVHPPIE